MKFQRERAISHDSHCAVIMATMGGLQPETTWAAFLEYHLLLHSKMA